MPKYNYTSDIGETIERYFSYAEELPRTVVESGTEYRLNILPTNVIYEGEGWTKGGYSNADDVDRFKWDAIEKW